MKLSQSNFNLRWSPDSDLVRSYLIATVIEHFVLFFARFKIFQILMWIFKYCMQVC